MQKGGFQMRMKSLRLPLAMSALLAVASISVACKENKNSNPDWSEARTEMEAKGQEFLARARKEYAAGNYDEAQRIVENMSKTCNLAFNAREEGILLTDSIYIAKSSTRMDEIEKIVTESPDSLQRLQPEMEDLSQEIKFYHRKLDFDKKNKKQH